MAKETVIAVCQMNVIAKRPDLNTAKAIEWLGEAAACGAQVAVFPEMMIPGYMVGDDWEDQAFIADCASYAEDIHRAAFEIGIVAVFGNVTKHAHDARNEDGRVVKFNSVEISADFAAEQRCQYNKTNLVNYREFEDKRHFANGTSAPAVVNVGNIVISTTICEDGWDDDYLQKPIRVASRNIDRTNLHKRKSVHLNLSCSPFTLGKNAARDRRFAKHSELFDALIYVNNVGVQNNGKNVFVFDGSSTVYENGKFMCSLPPLVEGIGYVTFKEDRPVMAYTAGAHGAEWIFDNPLNTEDRKNHRDPKKHEVLAYAIREFCAQSGIKRVVIGLSGGIDSALSVMLHVKALGAENVITVNMPTKFNSKTTRDLAQTIATNLGVRYLEVPIGERVVELIDNVVMSADLDPKKFWIDTENIQARMRGAGVQAMLASGFGAVFPNNGNKAETTVGYCTMLGDMAGYLAPIADLWKHEVYEVSKELSDELGNVLPSEIFSLKPSAELSADHNVDQGKGDPIQYWYHDRLFASWVEPWCRLNIENSLAAYQESALKFLVTLGLQDRLADFLKLFPTDEAFISDLERWWKLFKGMGIVKRVQAPPIVVISRRAFGFDFREAVGSVHFTRKYIAMKQQLLQGNTTTTEKQEN